MTDQKSPQARWVAHAAQCRRCGQALFAGTADVCPVGRSLLGRRALMDRHKNITPEEEQHLADYSRARLLHGAISAAGIVGNDSQREATLRVLRNRETFLKDTHTAHNYNFVLDQLRMLAHGLSILMAEFDKVPGHQAPGKEKPCDR